jgi:polar amino acid transport system permease protein
MRERKLPFFYSLISILVLLVLGGVLVQSYLSLDYDWNFKVLLPYFWDSKQKALGLLFQGLLGTLKISLLSIAIGSALGVILGLLFFSRERVARTAVLIYVDIFRNTPVLVQLYVCYFVIGAAFPISAEQSGVLTLSLFCSAYVADLVRGSLVNFDRGQWEAAKSLGLTPLQIARFVVGPQTLRRLMPPLVGLFVSLVKDSSLVSVLGILDLTKAALNVVAVSFRSFETWALIALFYLVINVILSSFGRYLESRLSVSLK